MRVCHESNNSDSRLDASRGSVPPFPEFSSSITCARLETLLLSQRAISCLQNKSIVILWLWEQLIYLPIYVCIS